MPITKEQIANYIEVGRARGISDEELTAEVRKRIAASPAPTQDDPGTAALRKAEGLRPLSRQQEIADLIGDVAGKVIAPVSEIGLPLAAAFLTRGTGTAGAAAIQAAAAGVGNLLGQGVRAPGRTPSLAQAAVPTALAGLGTLATGGLGYGLARAGGAGKEAASEVMRRGTVGGAELAFRFDPAAEARILDASRRFLQNPPLTAGGAEEAAILNRAAAKGTTIPVKPLIDRLRSAMNVQEPTTGAPMTAGREQLSAQRSLNTIASRLEAEAARSGGSLPVRRFEQILSKQITKPTVRIGGKLEPSLQESEYIQALRKVKKDTIQDLAGGLETEGQRYIRARVAARREITAMEGLRKRLFTRDRAGILHPRENAIPTLRTVFKRAEQGDDTLLRVFEEFDEITGAGLTPHLRELSLRQSLSAEDRSSLIIVDGVVRSMSGLRSGMAELARAGARGTGKVLMVGSRPIGAGLGYIGQKNVQGTSATIRIPQGAPQ